jgi:aerobic carbon-monoxide dehydrogenase medium subunit
MTIRMRPFELAEPDTLAEALDLLADAGGEARIIGGGTALVPMIRMGLIRPDRLVSLQRLSATQLRVDRGWLEIGAMVTHRDILKSETVHSGWPLLAQASHRVATPAIRASATIGGNLSYAESASDAPPAMLCLEAEVQLASRRGAHSIPVTKFFRGFYDAAIEPGEIVTAVRIPPLPPGAQCAYERFTSRSAEDKVLVGVAAIIVVDSGGHCSEVRIGLGGVAPTPFRASRSEHILKGERLSEQTISAAAESAAAESDPLSDLMGSADYRRHITKVMVSRVLGSLLGRTQDASGSMRRSA